MGGPEGTGTHKLCVDFDVELDCNLTTQWISSQVDTSEAPIFRDHGIPPQASQCFSATSSPAKFPVAQPCSNASSEKRCPSNSVRQSSRSMYPDRIREALRSESP